MTVELMEQLARDLPEAQRQSEAAKVATTDQLEGWILSFREWGETFRILDELVKQHWYEAPADLRAETMNIVADWMELGVQGMKTLNEQGDLLLPDSKARMTTYVVAYMQSTMDFYRTTQEIVKGEIARKILARSSKEVQSKIEADYEQGKREKAEGLTTTFTVEEFEQRFR